jgi:hypothetical protein
MAEEVKGKAQEGNAQNCANMLWAFATLGERGAGSRSHHQRQQPPVRYYARTPSRHRTPNGCS